MTRAAISDISLIKLPRRCAASLPAVFGLFACLMAVPTRHAAAQILDTIAPPTVPGYDTGPGATVTGRAKPEYASPGIRVGNSLIAPELNESVGYDSNILGIHPAISSPVAITQPGVTVSTDWSNASIVGRASATNSYFTEHPNQNFTDDTFSVGGRYLLGRDTVSLAATHSDLHELSSGVDLISLSQPLSFHVNDIRANYLSTLGRFTIRPELSYTMINFNNSEQFGSYVDEMVQNRAMLVGGVSGSYELAPLRNVIVALRGTEQSFQKTDPYQPKLDSKSVAVLGGLQDYTDGLIGYYMLLGLQKQDFTSSAYRSQSAVVGEGAAVWTPTGLTTVTVKFRRAIEDAIDPTLIGFVYLRTRLQVDHELKRDILLHGFLQFEEANYELTSASANQYAAGGGVTWLLDRYARVSLDSSFTTRQSVQLGDYSRVLTLLSFRLGL